MKLYARTGFIAIMSLAAGIASLARAPLTFEERVRAQEAIERVYYNHRIWPKENSGPKPAPGGSEYLGRIDARVREDLLKRAAIEEYWGRPITPEQVQAELDRIVAGTKDPEVLLEILAALGNDSFLVAECLAEPILADRLARDWYATDRAVHEPLRALAQNTLRVARERADWAGLGDVVLVRTESGATDGTAGVGPGEDFQNLQAVWPPGGLPAEEHGRASDRVTLSETPRAFVIERKLDPSTGTVGVERILVYKKPLISWLTEVFSPSRSPFTRTPRPGADYCIPQIGEVLAAPTRAENAWSALPCVPDGAYNHGAVWTGTEMIVWGGSPTILGDRWTGFRYTPATDSWLPISTAPGCPASRTQFATVWTGREMLVWGGTNGSMFLGDGGAYDPAEDRWRALASSSGFLPSTVLPGAVWTGTEMIVWGGYSYDGESAYGARYDPSADAWTSVNAIGNPTARYGHSMVWTGSKLLLWGGKTALNELLTGGATFDPATQKWADLPYKEGKTPKGRYGQSAIWTGTEVIIWGGWNTVDGEYYGDGSSYNPTSRKWEVLPAAPPGVAQPRSYHSAVWTGAKMIIWGGYGEGAAILGNGSAFDPANRTWEPVSEAGSPPAPRALHSALWSGEEMILWGGKSSQGALTTGGRYHPGLASWVPINAEGCVPEARSEDTAVWTGAEMLIWGGTSGGLGDTLGTGGGYCPTTDSWSAMAPLPEGYGGRSGHSAVWTGEAMLVWSGKGDTKNSPGSGWAYSPPLDAWTQIPANIDAPASRKDHWAAWTGSHMIVGNGRDLGSNAYFRYGAYEPRTGLWTKLPWPECEPYDGVAVWTGGEIFATNGYCKVCLDPFAMTWRLPSTVDGPYGRNSFSLLAAGDRIIVWGGEDDGAAWNTGNMYDPVADAWSTPSTGAGVPQGRWGHSAVWTGSAMLVWGGTFGWSDILADSGAAYDSRADTWTPMDATGNPPSPRHDHHAAWTGKAMLVWGGLLHRGLGYYPGASGGAYCAPTPRQPLALAAHTLQPRCTAPRTGGFWASITGGASPYTVEWDFGDGSVATSGSYVTHEFPSAGEYPWEVLVRDGDGDLQVQRGSVTVPEACVITCQGLATPSTGYYPVQVKFSASAEVSLPGSQPSYRWDLGGGITSSQREFNYIFREPQVRPWSLTVTAPGAEPCEDTGAVTILENCTLGCSASVSHIGHIGTPVFFSASAESTCSGWPAYSWDFGDGNTSDQEDPSHTYTAPGMYSWTVTLTQAHLTCTQTGTITMVGDCSLTCSGTATPSSGMAPLAVDFSGMATPIKCSGTPAFFWDFGDGKRSSAPSPSHTYAEPGTYEWTMVVTADGVQCIQEGTVTASADPNPAMALGGGAAAAGSTVSVPVSLAAKGASFCGLTSEITFAAPVLTFTDAQPGPAATAAGKSLSFHTPSAGILQLAILGSNQSPIGDGIVAFLNFRVAQDASGSTVLNHTCGGTDCEGSVLSMSCPGGTVTFTSGVPGDCDNDSHVSIGEVQKAVNMFLGLIPPDCGVDCDGDGTVSIGEVQKVINAFLGMTVSC